VVFGSYANNLVANDTNGWQDVFLHDLSTGATTLVSRTRAGDATNSDSYAPDISDDGRLVSFASLASNLVAGDSNNLIDIFTAQVEVSEILVDGDFEIDTDADKQPDAWIGKGLQGDKLKCNTEDKFVAHTGLCAYRFKGGAANKSKLQQDLDLPALALGAGDTLTLTGYAKTGSGPMKFKVKLRVSYADDTTGKINLTAPLASGDYVALEGENSLTLTGTPITRIRVQIQDKSAGGKILIDSLSLLWTLEGEASPVIPLPLASNSIMALP
jgi:hypothetical protein